MSEKKGRLFTGLIIGIVFGFLLEKGGVTDYDILIGQLRLYDFTVIKIIFTAIVVTSLAISYLYPRGIIDIHPKSGSIKNSVIGGLIFGVGFGLLGYCPGTIAGAIGSGAMDALLAGLLGIIIGSAVFASMYSSLKSRNIIREDRYSMSSLFNSSNRNPFIYTLSISGIIIALMVLLESFNL